MSDVIDFTKAKERAQKRIADQEAGKFNAELELQWANEEIDAGAERFEELSNELSDISEYMVYLNTYLGALQLIAASTSEEIDPGMLHCLDEFAEQLSYFADENDEEWEPSPIQLPLDFGGDSEYEIVFQPDFLIDDN